MSSRDTPGNETIPTARLALIAAQLGLLLILILSYRIEETSGFFDLAPLIFFGFVVHSALPIRYRPPFFLLFSLTGIALLLGFADGVKLLAIGFVLIGICHLPVAYRWRTGVLLLAGGLLAALRGNWVKTSWNLDVLPIVGAIFMFRIVIYLYDLRHDSLKSSIWHRLSYFFLFPNVSFLLFPVIDFKTYCRTYYNEAAAAIYAKGIRWMFRGVIHLLAYRWVYYYLALTPGDVLSFRDLVQFVASSFLLYLRVSGLFHLIVGLLCLFGFNLPETHRQYFLASGFNDFWLRINIYWKEFMMKIVYYPIFVKLRGYPLTARLTLATASVFFCTWILHAYQWFWIQGKHLFTVVDTLFWSILGILVIINSLYREKHGGPRRARSSWSWRAAAILASQTVAMFVFMCLLWSFWSSQSIAEWTSVMAIAAKGQPIEYLGLGGALALLIGIGIFWQYATYRDWNPASRIQDSFSLRTGWILAVTAILILVGLPGLRYRFGARFHELIQSFKSHRLNQRDAELQERGYYENLLQTNAFAGQLWAPIDQRPETWTGLSESQAVRVTAGLPKLELRESVTTIFKGATLKTNRWGMRDQEYDVEKRPNTYRIAMLGASYLLGEGVEAEESFEALVEARLNGEYAAGSARRYEVLNFGVGGYGLVEMVTVLDNKALAFHPDAVFCVVHGSGKLWLTDSLVWIAQQQIALPYPELNRILLSAGVKKEMNQAELERRLVPYIDQITVWGYRTIVQQARAHGAVPVWLFLPRTEYASQRLNWAGAVVERCLEGPLSRFAVNRNLPMWIHFEKAETAMGLKRVQFFHLRQLAEDAGFAILDLTGVYDGYDAKDIRSAPRDNHPNALGHRLIADRLYTKMIECERLLNLDLVNANGGGVLSTP